MESVASYLASVSAQHASAGNGQPAQSHWPLIEHSQVYHLGQLDKSAKGSTHNGTSYEGNGLSVSTCPQAWQAIARLGGVPAWSVAPVDAATTGDSGSEQDDQPTIKFLDVHALTAQQIEAIEQWGVEQGLCEQASAVELSWLAEDRSGGARRAMLFDLTGSNVRSRVQTEEKALADEGAEEVRASEVQVLKATAALCARIGFAVDLGPTRDMLITTYAEDVLYPSHGIAGCWWTDELDEQALSAPRGVIHRSALEDPDQGMVIRLAARPGEDLSSLEDPEEAVLDVDVSSLCEGCHCDEEGGVKVVYHGASAAFVDFDSGRLGQTAGVGAGYFFTSCERAARDIYGWRSQGVVHAAVLTLDNPMTWDQYLEYRGLTHDEATEGHQDPTNHFDENWQLATVLARQYGHDGIAWPADADSRMSNDLLVAFDLDQVRVLMQTERLAIERSQREWDDESEGDDAAALQRMGDRP